jgi:hypothetical protein
MDPTNPGQTLPDEQVDAAAKVLGVQPQRIDLRTASDLDRAFAATLRQRTEALLVYPLPITPHDFQRVAEFRLPGSRRQQQSWHRPGERDRRQGRLRGGPLSIY